MADFMLVHGAFTGGWIWKDVARLLRQAGHEVLAPTLTGMGERAHLFSPDLQPATAVQDLAGVALCEEPRDLVLVGHGLGALPTLALAARIPERVRGVVLVDGLVTGPREAVADIADTELARLLAVHTEGRIVRPWPLPAFGVREEEHVRRFSALLGPTPLNYFTEPFRRLVLPPDIPRAYIRTAQIDGFLDRMADAASHLGFAPRHMNSGHCPMATEPHGLAKALLDLAVGFVAADRACHKPVGTSLDAELVVTSPGDARRNDELANEPCDGLPDCAQGRAIDDPEILAFLRARRKACATRRTTLPPRAS